MPSPGMIDRAALAKIFPDPRSLRAFEAVLQQLSSGASDSALLQPEAYGAKGDGVTDDTAAINDCLVAAADSGGEVEFAAGKTYRTTTSILVPSGVSIRGYGAVLSFAGGDVPAMASKGYLDGTSPSGRTTIKGLRIICTTPGGAAQHGLVLRDYYSLLEDCEVSGFGANGIHVTNLTAGGVTVGSTLVENKIVRPIVRGCAGIAIYLGPDGNNKVTDGFLLDPIIQQPASNLNQAIYCGSAAGWKFEGGHIYGSSPTTAVEIRNSYFTDLGGFYIEGYTTNAFNFGATQNALRIGSNRVNAQDALAGSSVIRIGRSGAFASPRATVGVQHIRQVNNIAINNVLTESAALVVQLERPRVDGNAGATAGGPAYVTSFATLGANTNNMFMGLVGRMTNVFTDDTTLERMYYNGRQIPTYNGAYIWQDAIAQTINHAIPKLANYDELNFLVTIYSRSFHNGSIVNKAVYSVYVKSKVNGTDAWTIRHDALPMVDQLSVTSPSPGVYTVSYLATGFAVAPVFTVADAGDGTGTVTCTFTPSGGNPYGSVKFAELAGRAKH